MTDDVYLVAIALLLPISAGMAVFQTNPYHALVIRGILGALAALVYALFGAADVALTEALVGTMLSITLYAIAVRSSMRMRLGLFIPVVESDDESSTAEPSEQIDALRKVLQPHHMNLETVTFSTLSDMHAALSNKDLHGILLPPVETSTSTAAEYELQVRIPALSEILQSQSPDAIASVKLVVDEASIDQQSDTVSLRTGVES